VVFQFAADLFYANYVRFAADVRGFIEGAPTPLKWLILNAAVVTAVDYSAARLYAICTRNYALAADRSCWSTLNRVLADIHRHRISEIIVRGHVFETLHEAPSAINAPPMDPDPKAAFPKMTGMPLSVALQSFFADRSLVINVKRWTLSAWCRIAQQALRNQR
jgi:hypothetical protein